MKYLIESLNDEFEINKTRIYLDNAAMSPLPRTVKRAIEEFHENRMCNGPDFIRWWDKVEFVRSLISNKINSSSDEITFTSNTSMGINLAAKAIPFTKGDNVIITNLEFPSNVYPWMNLVEEGVEVKFVNHIDGTIKLSEIDKLVDCNTKAISISWVMASNGFKINLQELGDYCEKRNIIFIVDAIQGLGIFELDVNKIKVDFLISGFFKWMLGTDGIAFAYINKNILDKLRTPYIGWAGMKEKFNYTAYKYEPVNEAKRYETGNMNFSAIYGIEKALILTSGLEEVIEKKILELTKYLRKGLDDINKNDIKILSPTGIKNISGITLFSTTKDMELYNLMKDNSIIVNYRNGIRVSPHFYNTKDEIDLLLNIADSI